MKHEAQTLLANPIDHFPAATVACFDVNRGALPRRRLDAERTGQFLRALEGAGARSLLIGASTGHGHARNLPELSEWFQVAAEADLRQATCMALLRPEDGLQANQDLLDLLRDLGYSIVFFRPSTGCAPDTAQEALVEQLAPLVNEAAGRGFAVGLYSISDVSGVPLSAEATAALVAQPGGQAIVAAKITEANYESSTEAYLRHPRLKHLKIVQGWDPHLARALQDGPQYEATGRQRCGVTSGPMSFAIYQYLHLLESAAHGDWRELARSQVAVTRLFAAMQDDPAKFADLQRAKYVMGLGHPLDREIDRSQAQAVLDALRALEDEEDRRRMARSLDLMQDGPYHETLQALFPTP